MASELKTSPAAPKVLSRALAFSQASSLLKASMLLIPEQFAHSMYTLVLHHLTRTGYMVSEVPRATWGSVTCVQQGKAGAPRRSVKAGLQGAAPLDLAKLEPCRRIGTAWTSKQSNDNHST